jgi:hypothetical protein
MAGPTARWALAAIGKGERTQKERSLKRLVDMEVSRKKELGFLWSLAEARRTTQRK